MMAMSPTSPKMLLGSTPATSMSLGIEIASALAQGQEENSRPTTQRISEARGVNTIG